MTLTRGMHDQIWKVEVPKLAYSHPFLMHNLLSTAAYHRAYLTDDDPEKRKKYVNDGRNHFCLALQGMREVLRKENITPDNCHAVFPASTLLFIGAMCGNGPCFSPSPSPATTTMSSTSTDREEQHEGKSKSPMIDELLNIFRTVKGIDTVVRAQQDLLRNGPVGALFVPEGSRDVKFPRLDRLLAQLHAFYLRVASVPYRSTPGAHLSPLPLVYDFFENGHSWSAKENRVVLREITAMETAINSALENSRTPEQEIVAVWPINLSGEFVELLEDPTEKGLQGQGQGQSASSPSSVSPPPGYRNPVALALLAYYCCLMKESERRCWFTKDWAEAVMKEVVAELGKMAGVVVTMSATSTSTCTSSGVSGNRNNGDIRGPGVITVSSLEAQIQGPGGQQHLDHTQGQTNRTDRPPWREWVRREWLGDALWAWQWVMAETEDELPRHSTTTTTFPDIPMATHPSVPVVVDTGTQGQPRQQQQPPTTSSSDVPMTGTQAQQQPRTASTPGPPGHGTNTFWELFTPAYQGQPQSVSAVSQAPQPSTSASSHMNLVSIAGPRAAEEEGGMAS